MMRACNLSLFALTIGVFAVADTKDGKSRFPGNAEWELRAFDALFRVVQTDYDAGAKKVKWLVETRDGQRTSDFLRDIARSPFTFHFMDGDNELATVQLGKADFQGIPTARVMKEGTRLTIILEVPRAMEKTKKVVLRRGRS